MKNIMLLVIAAILVCGCSSKVNTDKPSSMLIQDGNLYMKNRSFSNAATAFEAAVLNSDSPEDARIAQKLLADARFSGRKWAEAIAAYETYYDLYQRDPETPHVLFRIGVAYSKISRNARADQHNTQQSVTYLTMLKNSYPDRFKEMGAEAYLEAMLWKLAEHEYSVADYYVRIKQPESAIYRLLYLLNNYPDSHRTQDAYALMVKASAKIPGQEYLSKLYLDELEEKYPEDERISELRRIVESAQEKK